MTLQEAIKSGRKFKRLEHDRWFFIDGVGIVCDTSDNKPSIFRAVSLLADDWEVKEAQSPKERGKQVKKVLKLNDYR